MNLSRVNKILLISFLTLSFFGGLFDFAFRNHPGSYGAYDSAIAIATAIIIFSWYCHDANSIGYKRTVWLNVSVFALSVVSLPYYFFRSRGLKKGGAFFVLFIAILMLYFLLAIVGTYVGDNFVYPAWS